MSFDCQVRFSGKDRLIIEVYVSFFFFKQIECRNSYII